MIPTATLHVESQMTSTPKPVAIGVIGEGKKVLAIVTLEDFHRCAAELERLEADIRSQPGFNKFKPKES